MIGYITNEQTANTILEAIDNAMLSRGLPCYWTIGKYEICKGEHMGNFFIPASDDILNTPLYGNPPMTPKDFPEFTYLIGMMGGLENRIEIDPEDIAIEAID